MFCFDQNQKDCRVKTETWKLVEMVEDEEEEEEGVGVTSPQTCVWL